MMPFRADPDRRRCSITIGTEVVAFDWGAEYELGSTAYWIGKARRAQSTHPVFALGRNLAEEVTACMLGGYGVPSSVGLAAFDAVRDQLELDSSPTAARVTAVLEEPIRLGGGARVVRYRFPRQRGERIAAALKRLQSEAAPAEPLQLRQWLQSFEGIGPKTASWIVRNYTGSDDVAIIDIHVQRAGVAAGFFKAEWRVSRHYERFEAAFLEVARLGGVRASVLDACIWYELQRLGRLASLLHRDAA